MTQSKNHLQILRNLLSNPTLLVSALGYFVDLFDLVLFGVVRIPSLKSLNLNESEIFSVGTYLLNCQMAGLLIGGFAWGLLADRYGRLKALFSSIILYSVANFANAFVTTVDQYAALRFIAGLGLAGELGIAVTLVSESIPKNYRGYASAVIAFAGFLGAIVAATTSAFVPWTVAFMIGGGLGILLLLARLKLRESPLHQKLHRQQNHWVRLKSLFANRKHFIRFVLITTTGLPIWFTAGILIYFSPELAKSAEVRGPISAGTAILISYIGSLMGDLLAGFLSQHWQSRKKVLRIGLICTAGLAFIDLFLFHNVGPTTYYGLIFLLGVANGYWALYVTYATEQFGTNLRATVTTSIPNLVRASVIPMSAIIHFLKPHTGLELAVASVGGFVLIASFLSLARTQESFHIDLDFHE